MLRGWAFALGVDAGSLLYGFGIDPVVAGTTVITFAWYLWVQTKWFMREAVQSVWRALGNALRAMGEALVIVLILAQVVVSL